MQISGEGPVKIRSVKLSFAPPEVQQLHPEHPPPAPRIPMHRFALAVVAVVALAGTLFAQPGQDKKQPARVLPGLDDTGAARLHNQWSIRPAGKQLELGD